MRKKTKFMFRKNINTIHNIGLKDSENGEVAARIFVEEKWANQYCESVINKLKVDRFNKAS